MGRELEELVDAKSQTKRSEADKRLPYSYSVQDRSSPRNEHLTDPSRARKMARPQTVGYVADARESRSSEDAQAQGETREGVRDLADCKNKKGKG